MAKVKLTRMNFTNYISNNLNKFGSEGMFLDVLTGGKAKDMISNVPDKQTIFIDTNHVVAVGSLIKFEETGDVVFQIYFDCNDPKMQNMWIDGNEFEQFINAWKGE